ncbi:hypothetical protein KIW84_062622 [Lathyrus oleraceus]|uniref:RING-type E3 ubiquitin transferase n=1 Tax=Pisum sativum TaxID=3888 RepID=A0A9D4W5I9_PEA|nr:hypothetical protein KIW84_062622 [Pisum sativum]
MAQQHNNLLPCKSDGICMICNHRPLESEIVCCRTCATPWHVPCLPLRPLKIFDWNCTDCSQPVDVNHVADASAPPITCSLVSTIYANENDTSLTGEERAKKSHEVYDRSPKPPFENNNKYNDLAEIPANMASDPQINAQLDTIIQMAISESVAHGKIFVTISKDHFGPIVAENDPIRNRGVLVGYTWEGLMECIQWGAHFPHDSRIASQSVYGAQSVALFGDYIDEIDHGNWFLYSGSCGNDLSGNKRTNKNQSHTKKRSSYAPKAGVRYDGVYRIEKWWRKIRKQGHKVCRYLFVRCDNEPAPWTSELSEDRPYPLPIIEELNNAIDIIERKGDPSWGFDVSGVFY